MKSKEPFAVGIVGRVDMTKMHLEAWRRTVAAIFTVICDTDDFRAAGRI